MSTERRRRNGSDGLFIVGLVGRAGSGKSTVARALERGGAPVIDADRIGHQVTDHDPEVRSALIAEYGPAIYRPDGALDRARVGERVFTDRAARQRLDRLVHPRILDRIHARLAELRASGWRGVVVVDAALMLDWGFERECDALIAITAPEAEQISRLARARGWTEAQARARHAAQRDDAAYAAAADVVIDNRGSEAELAAAATRALERLQSARRA
jgi:dephospho-CoA kinase